MFKYSYFLISFICALIVSSASFAQFDEDKTVTKLMEIVRTKLPEAKLPNGSFVPPETEEEKKYPIIPIEDAKRALKTGTNTAIVKWCGFDGIKYSYFKFMQQERAKKTWSDKQMAYIGLLHGMMQGETERMLQTKGDCPPNLAEQVKQKLR